MNKSKLGMTFVEVIIAMAIFAILIVAIFPAFLIGAKMNQVSKVSVEASNVARTALEEVYVHSTNSTFDLAVTSLSSTYNVTAGPLSNQTTLTKTTGDYHIQILFSTNTPSAGMVSAIVIVTKTDNPYGASPAQAETILLFD